MNEQICEAIRDRKLIQFQYEGLSRVVEPYCYGIATTGNELVRAYQVEGSSSTGKLEWKFFDIDKIIDLEVLDESFNVNNSDFKPNDPVILEVFCAVS